eukprot:3888465-Amphidinium_carterae.1
MARAIRAQQEVSLGQIRAEFEKAQQEIEGLREHVDSAERERDVSMQQLAAERIRTSQMQTQGSQLLFEKDVLQTQLMDLARHAAQNGACQDIQWTSSREPEGFSTFVDQVANSTDAGIHVVPPFANQQVSRPPGLFDAANETPTPKTPDRRPQQNSSSPMFGLFDGGKGVGGGRKGGAESTPDGVDGAPNSLSDRSDRKPWMGRGSGSTRTPGRGFPIGGGGGGPNDPNDPFGSPGSRDTNFNNRSPLRPLPKFPRGGDGGGGGGGDDGDDDGGGDYPGGPHRAWNGYVQEYRINRDRKPLPKLDVIEQHFQISAATLQQKILNWVRDATKKIGTWHLDAPIWFERTVKEAKQMHYKYVKSSPNEQCDIERMYVLGRSAPIPRPEHALESLARCEILDALPEWLKKQVNNAGMHSTKYVMWFVLKVLQPSPDYLRIGISRDLMAKAQDVKTYARAVEWLEIFYQKLEVAVEINVKIEAQEVLQHLVQTVQNVCYNDMKTTMIWTRLTDNEYTMTSEFSLKDVLDMTRAFTVELKLIVRRKRQTAAIQYSLSSCKPQVAAIEDEVPEEGDEDDPTA